jgi:hypothetical protein
MINYDNETASLLKFKNVGAIWQIILWLNIPYSRGPGIWGLSSILYRYEKIIANKSGWYDYIIITSGYCYRAKITLS